jgi:flagellum-specific peptidoglycan hydrolase FlgJ
MGGGSPWELAERQRFQKEATVLAKEMEGLHGVPWQVTYAQAVLESGW